MKDVHLTTLKAVVLTLAQQSPEAPLPPGFATAITPDQAIEQQIMALHTLFQGDPSLAPTYRQARQWLTRQAAERGLGKDFLDAPADAQPDTERLNLARDTAAAGVEFQQVLDTLNAQLQTESPERLLTQLVATPHPIQVIKTWLGSAPHPPTPSPVLGEGEPDSMV